MSERSSASGQQSLSAKAARNLATATVTVPQMVQITRGGCANFSPG